MTVRTCFRPAFLLALCGLATAVLAGEFGFRYVKTLGQTNVTGIPFVAAGARLAVDEQGNLYTGTPGIGSYLQKCSPEGKIIWQRFENFPAFQGLALDKDYLYTAGGGQFGFGHLQRWKRESGEPAPGWELHWREAKPLNGVRPMLLPSALLVDDLYLFVLDSRGNELRRLDKATGQEKPFNMRLMVDTPMDLAWSKTGAILLLTDETVLEIDKEGKPLRVPLIGGLHRATAIDVDRKTGLIYLAEGGQEAALINRVRQFTPDGKPTGVEIGHGGDFHGKWAPTSFAFSSRTGDIALDPQGGIWVNPGYGEKFPTLQTLVHFSPVPPQGFKTDRLLWGVNGDGIVADGDLTVYVGGQYAITWENHLRWTSGLTSSGDQARFPGTLPYWFNRPVSVADGTVFFVNGNASTAYAYSPETGALRKPPLRLPAEAYASCAAGRHIFLMGWQQHPITRIGFDLAGPPQPFFTPAPGQAEAPSFAVSEDQQYIYLIAKRKISCYRRDGTLCWEGPEADMVSSWYKGLLFTAVSHGNGVSVLDAATGEPLGVIGAKEVDGIRPLYRVKGMAAAAKDGRDYLFVLSESRVVVYEFRLAR